MRSDLVRGIGARCVTLLAAASFATSVHAADITIAAGSPGGGYFQAAAALAEYIKAEIKDASTTVMPGGSWANVDRLGSKQADLAVIENVVSTLAWTGDTPTKKKYDFRMIAAVRGPSIAQAVIPKDRGIKGFDEIRTMKKPVRIAMFERTQVVTAMALDMLSAYGISDSDLRAWGGKIVYTSLNEGLEMINDGRVDMWFTGGSLLPHPKFLELGSKSPFMLLPISKDVASKVAQKYGAGVDEVPANVYKSANGENAAYWSPSLVICFAARTDLSADLVYKITDALAKNKEKFWAVDDQHKLYKPEIAWKNVGQAPLHPGAERWYKEKGYIK